MQGKNEQVQTFVLCSEQAVKAMKQQHPHAMTEDEGVKHLKDHLLHGLKPNIHRALCYMYHRSDSQYSQLVMAAWKAEAETPGGSVSEERIKSTVVGMDSQVKVASSDLPYEALTRQIAYLMSTITNQNASKDNDCIGSKQSNGNGKFSNTNSSTKFQRSKRDRRDMKCWGCGGTGHSWRECSTPRQGNNLPFKLTNQSQIRIQIKI